MMTNTHLPKSALRFLGDLAKHNDKAWFEANRERCDEELIEPAKRLVGGLCEAIAKPFPEIAGSTKAVGGSLTRLHRDVRFSKDKRPFHEHVGMHFWHRAGRKMETPGFFVRVDPKEVLLATGLHQPEPTVLANIRRKIDRDRKLWSRVRTAAFVRSWADLEGESLKRVPAPWPSDHEFADDLRRKDFTAFIRLPSAEVTKANFAQIAVGHWKASAPLMSFLCDAMSLE